MLCYRCKKRPAVVFLSRNDTNPNLSQGLCIKCAKEVGIKPVNDMIEKMGISDEDIEDMDNQLSEIMTMDPEMLNSEEMNDFIKAGTAAFPFLQNIFPDSVKPIENDGIKRKDKMADEKKDNKKSEKKKSRKNINTYCYDLTKRARDGHLDRVIGRDKEINRVVHILSRRTKNNPCLIGEPGVGKTAIAEGLAIKIANGDVPFKLKEKEIHLLDLTSLVAGTQFRGQFEGRIKNLIEEVKSDSNVILFIDEVHNLVGTGDSEGSMNAANILKPALSRGEIQVIGATTFSEYRKYIEKDSALERRFQPVTVAEPSVSETIDVLIGIKSYYEDYHRVKISDEIIKKAVKLSERYITDRFLPDKAIDLLDESCASAALRNLDLEEYDKLKYEMESLEKEQEELLIEKENVDYEKLANVRYKLSSINEELRKKSLDCQSAQVDEDDLSHVIEIWTGIPSSKIQENQFEKLSNLESKLKAKVIGQDKAIDLVASAVRRKKVQISKRRRPSSFIFVGPTGVGKTELVKVLSDELFDTPDNLIRLDMSEFMEKHSVSKIIGSPPGYVGYDESGQLTEKVRRRPYSILLLDEIEKAHPDVMNILLQILDEGKITDSHGRVVNFENTIIIMTSNAGSNKKDGSLGFAKTDYDMSKEKVMKALEEFLRPEFISRIDEIVIFSKLNEADFNDIAKLILNEYVDTLLERSINFSYDDKAVKLLAKKSINGKSGARDLRNLIRREVEDKIASLIIEGKDFNIKNIELTEQDGLKFKVS